MMHDYLSFQDSIDVLLERTDGTAYSFKEAGIGVADFAPGSPYYETEYEKVERRNGSVDLGTSLGSRQIKASFYFVAFDMQDYALKRDEVFAILDSRTAFYISESRNPHKRWYVKIDGSFEPDQARIFGFFDITFVAASGLAESRGTTLDPLTTDEEIWQFGQGLVTEDDISYVHSTSTFSIYNAGNVLIDPREMPLVIAYVGASNNLTIQNLTTGDEWSYTGNTAAGDAVQLNGIRSLKNGSSIFGNTNKKLITLAPGVNEFELIGTSGAFEISFDTKFYYL